MSQILVVGIATLDIINHVSAYPAEDTEIRALTSERRRGGNAANTAVVLSQLGHHCDWAGVLSDDPDGDFISADLCAHGIDLSPSYRISNGRTPTSYVIVSRTNGSRTIVHYRNLPEYSAAHFKTISLKPYRWLHFEGRNCTEVRMMLQHAREQFPELPLSLEIEKPRPGIETLYEYADLLLFSRDFAEFQGHHSATTFLTATRSSLPKMDLVCTWGADGAWCLAADAHQIEHCPAIAPARVVDTLAAGDTFNAAVIAARCQGMTLSQAVSNGCRIAGHKCGISGLDLGIAGPGPQIDPH